jgi:DNA polymerase III delta subunit
MKEQADRLKKRASKRAKERANPERIENAVKIQLRIHTNLMSGQKKMDATDWAEIEELWRGL